MARTLSVITSTAPDDEAEGNGQMWQAYADKESEKLARSRLYKGLSHRAQFLVFGESSVGMTG
ncbi:hypothetical protein [Lusitaniella coriacea]|uniref:hypothetical protein n=1 Tax=Lusitaniella coriacea TaxID=1983105 RepID=UPI003CF26869